MEKKKFVCLEQERRALHIVRPISGLSAIFSQVTIIRTDDHCLSHIFEVSSLSDKDNGLRVYNTMITTLIQF